MKYSEIDINRFIEAQQSPFCGYEVALKEIQNGKKTSHWMWYIFPQFREFAHSSRAHYWGIIDLAEAERYLNHPILGVRLREITRELLVHKNKTALEILGEIDAKKLRSCMTMFDSLMPNDIFGEVLDSFYNGERGGKTLRLINQQKSIGN
ncbi:MAG: DUF1810 domain-containing protein [Alphaproteobacteria bacterium]|nr:DUF1810 domain-containing protein [Alphaproteobacteria bacterium]